MRDRDDAGRMLHRTHRREDLIGDDERASSAVADLFGETDERRHDVLEQPLGKGGHLDLDAGRERFPDQVLAVEQHVGRPVVGVLFARIPAARQLAEALHDGVLPAGDAFHAVHVRLLFTFLLTFPLVKERLLKRFEEEIAQLDRELKTELPKEIKRARELGDLRENAEYQAAKERQRLVESRISLLQKRVSEISLMNLDRIPRGKVGFGSTVTLRDQAGQTVVYQLVMPEDANVEEGLISTASPIGRALLSKEEGDEVHVRTPNGVERVFEVVKLVTIHE